MPLNPTHQHDVTPGKIPKRTLVDYSPLLGLIGTASVFLGTLFLLSTAILSKGRGVESRITNLIGAIIVGIGTSLFFLNQIIFGNIPVLVGSFLLTLAMWLYAGSMLAIVFHGDHYITLHDHTGIHGVQVAALGLVIIAVSIMAVKAYLLARKPLWGFKNYLLFGVSTYGIGAVTLFLYALESLIEDFLEDMAKGGPAFGMLYLACGGFLLMLFSARTHYNLDCTLEDRYPCTVYLYRGYQGAWWAFIACCIITLGRLWCATVRLLCDDSIEPAGWLLTGGDVVLGFGVILYAAAMLTPRRKEADEKMIKAVKVIGVAAWGLASWARGIGFAAKEPHELNHDENFVAAIAGIFAVLGQWALVAYVARRAFRSPRLLHPSNYVLLAALIGSVGDLCQLIAAFGCGAYHDHGIGSDLSQLGACIAMFGSVIYPLHAGMAIEIASIDSFEGYEYGLEKGWSDEAAVPNASYNSASANKSSAYNKLPSTPSENVAKEVDVLICGAGPVGLFLANDLGKMGVNALIIEQRDDIIEDPRFFVLLCHTTEALDRVGILEDCVKAGVDGDIPFGAVWVDGLGHPDARILGAACTPGRNAMKQVLPLMDPVFQSRCCGSRHASEPPLRIMQSRQEGVLKAGAENCKSVEVSYGQTLLEFREYRVEGKEPFVDALIMPNNSDVSYVVRARFLVGSDGPGGPVARSLGFKYDGFANVTETRSCLIKSPALTEHMIKNVGLSNQYQVSREGLGVGLFTHVDPANGWWNFIASWFHEPAKAKDYDGAIKEFMGPIEYEANPPKHWYWNFFIARSFHKGQVFLCGDSAHSWPPVCGMGGNSGYGDVANVGWKLNALVKGWGGRGLVEGYTIERRNYCLRCAQCVMGCMPQPRMMLLLNSLWFRFKKFGIWWIAANKWGYANSGTHLEHHNTSGAQFIRCDYSPLCMPEPYYPPDDPYQEYTPRILNGARLPHVPMSTDGRSIFHSMSKDGFTLFSCSVVFDNADNADDFTPAETTRLSFTQIASRATNVSRISVFTNFTAEACSSSISNLKCAFKNIGAPLKIVNLRNEKGKIFPNSGVLKGAHRQCARLYSQEALVLVRPDRTVVWHLRRGDVNKLVDPDMANQIVNTVTGNITSDAASKSQTALRWLTSRFIFSLRPFGFIFPKAIPLVNQTKEEAIDKLKQASGGKCQGLTTKQAGNGNDDRAAKTPAEQVTEQQSGTQRMDQAEVAVPAEPNCTQQNDTLWEAESIGVVQEEACGANRPYSTLVFQSRS